MKKKVVNPDIQVKKKQQALEKEMKKDLEAELREENLSYPKKISKHRSQSRHK